MKIRLIVLGFLLVSISSCKKDSEDEIIPAGNEFDLAIHYKVDNDALTANNLIYTNQAGYSYSITKLNYYVSEIKFIKSDSSLLEIKEIKYFDAFNAATNKFTFNDLTPGNYIGLSFNIGIDSAHNISNSLPATTENLNMAWPDIMGGGYHFLMFEGNFMDSTGTHGFTMHLGTNSCLIPVKVYQAIKINNTGTTSVSMTMNINEWFRNPHTFDFNIDGNHIMGNMPAMMKVASNGADVFNF